MFIIKLDIPWIDSPFLKHSRLIKTHEEIMKLREAGVQKLVIDLEKGSSPQQMDEASKPASVSRNKKKVAEDTLQGSTASTNLDTELHAATQLRSQIKNTLNTLNAKLERNLPIDTEEITPLVDSTLSSLERNDQALMNLAHMGRRAQKLIDHAFSTFCLALNVAVEMRLEDDERLSLGIAALLHDSGWLQLPLHLMGKRTAYTTSEKKLVESHVVAGLKLLGPSQLPEIVMHYIAEHHERSDGSGYPKGMTNDRLHGAGKIISAVVHYDELVHQLTDKPGMLPTNALRTLYMEAERGRFDPEVVAALINVLGVYPVSSAVRLNTGEKAIVEEVHRDTHLEPVVRIIYSSNNRLLPEPLRVDLHSQTQEPRRKIDSVLDPSNTLDDPDHRLRTDYE